MKIPTAEEFLIRENLPTDILSGDDINYAMIEFAKLHCEAQAKAIYEKAKINVVPTDEEPWEIIPEVITSEDLENNEGIMLEVDKDSILNAYPLTNIK